MASSSSATAAAAAAAATTASAEARDDDVVSATSADYGSFFSSFQVKNLDTGHVTTISKLDKDTEAALSNLDTFDTGAASGLFALVSGNRKGTSMGGSQYTQYVIDIRRVPNTAAGASDRVRKAAWSSASYSEPWRIYRRFKEFRELHAGLKLPQAEGSSTGKSVLAELRERRGSSAARLPEKTVFADKLDPAVVIERQAQLQKYLNEVLENVDPRQCKVLATFLGFGDITGAFKTGGEQRSLKVGEGVRNITPSPDVVEEPKFDRLPRCEGDLLTFTTAAVWFQARDQV